MARPKFDVPDTVFPSTNEFEIPDLLLSLQGDLVDAPVRYFGEVSRHSRHAGTYHFYTEDKKFQGIWKDPGLITRSACPSVCEVNYSTSDQMPAAVGLYGIYQKRWLSRLWQSHGIRIWVDLWTDPKFDRFTLLGVPKGWQAFSYRTSDDRLDDLRDRIAFAKAWSGVETLKMLIVGGSSKTIAFCAENGYQHLQTAVVMTRE